MQSSVPASRAHHVVVPVSTRFTETLDKAGKGEQRSVHLRNCSPNGIVAMHVTICHSQISKPGLPYQNLQAGIKVETAAEQMFEFRFVQDTDFEVALAKKMHSMV